MIDDYAYAAGLMDGEGTVRVKKKGGFAIEIEMSDYESVRYVNSVFGGSLLKSNRQTTSGRDVWRWSVYGQNAISFARVIYPFSRTKRRQLEVVLRFDDIYPVDSTDPARVEVRKIAGWQLTALKAVAVVPITFDIETMGFEMAEKRMLSCTFQMGDEEGKVWTSWKTGPFAEGELPMLLETRTWLEAAPWTIGFNSSRFDIPYINARLAVYGERPMFLGSHDDVSEDYKRLTGRKKRTSLHDMSNELGLTDEKVFKTPIDWDIWHAADAGVSEALDYVVEHADMDVILTKRGHNAIKKIEYGTE